MQTSTTTTNGFYLQQESKKNRTFGVRAKLFSSFGTLVALIAGVGFVGWQNTQSLAENSRELYTDQLQGTIYLNTATSSLWNLRRNIPQYIVEPKERKSIQDKEPLLFQKLTEALENYRKTKLKLSPEEKQALTKLEERMKLYADARVQVFDLVDAGKTNEASDLRQSTAIPLGNETVGLLDTLVDLQLKQGEQKTKEVESSIKTLTAAIVIVLFLALVIATILAIFLGRNITEIVLNAVKNITSNSGRISTTVSVQERTVLEQTSSVNETTSIIEDLGVFALKSAEQADRAAGGAREALTLAEGGTQTVGRTIDGISGLRDQVTAIANQIIRLSEQTAQIATVSDLVADLANQTNMLALNAGVEAARAGEQGKGFAVVASEIRKLADQSRKSADRINSLVNALQAAINSTVMVTDEGTKKATVGIELAEETGDVFANIADAVNLVFLNTQQIAQSSKQQAVSVQQVVAAMNIINLGAKETAAGIVQVKDATNDLNKAAENLEAVV